MTEEARAHQTQTSAAFSAVRGSASAFKSPSGIGEAASSARKTRRLVVNADDFGMSEEVNQGIIAAFRRGVLTSCSLMVTGRAFEQAVALAKENPKLAVGIHLVAVMGRSVLPKSAIPTLVDKAGNFPNNPTAAGLKYYFSPRARRELRSEIAAQFERFAGTGLPLSHIDGHLHLHIHPVIFKAALELGSQYGARRMRSPDEERALALRFDSSRPLLKTGHAALFGALAAYMKKRLTARGFKFPQRVYGNLQSGAMSEDYFLYALDNLRAETNEIYFHPALYRQERTLSKAERQCLTECEALLSGRVAARIAELDIELINYFDLERSE